MNNNATEKIIIEDNPYYVFLHYDNLIQPLSKCRTIKGLENKLDSLGIKYGNLKEQFKECSNLYVGRTEDNIDVYVSEILDWTETDDL